MIRNVTGLLAFIFASTLLAACSINKAQEQGNRGPNSLVDGTRVDSALSEITGSQRSQNETEALLISIAKIYFRSQDYVKEFDRQLDDPNNTSPMTSLTYAHLMAGRLFMETAGARVVSRYEDLLTAYWEALDQQGNVSEIQARLNEFRRTVNQSVFMTGGNRIALQDVVAELSEAPLKTYIDFHGPQNRVPVEVASMQDFKSFLFKDTKELTAYIEDSTNKSDFNAKVAEALTDRVVQRSVQLIAPFLQLELQAQLDTRTPQSVAPGTGRDGNLTGDNFPHNTWALTFDDGPSRFTMPILANLKNHGIKATFFWLAKMVNAKGAGLYISTAKAAGMDLNNHSYTHANLVNLGAEGLQREIVTSTAIEAQAYGSHPRFFRCPYGSGLNTPRVRSMIAQQGMVHVFWNVDSLDWQDHNPNSIIARVRKQMANAGRGIILFHDIHPQSVTASNVIMGDLAKLRAVTMTQIKKELNGEK